MTPEDWQELMRADQQLCVMVSGNLCNMNTEAQKRALAASRKAASSVFADVGDNEDSSIAAGAAPAQGHVKRVEYSAEMAEIGFPAQSGD